MVSKLNKSDVLVLTGIAGKDFSSFLRHKNKSSNFVFGLSLIKNYTKNRVLYSFLLKLHETDPELALKKLVSNLKIIQRKWRK